MKAVEATALTKRFGRFTAVDRVSFDVDQGSIFGFLGPNGSGKSTCIRMLCGLLEPTEGGARVNGFEVREDPERVKESIGYMSQAFSLYKDLSVRENLQFFGGIFGLSGTRLKDRMEAVVSLLGLAPYGDRISGLLSGGWKQRLALAAALIHEPKLVFLDEPTAGIDPVARRDLWDLLFDLSAQGQTFFVSTHYMDEAERCDQVGYIYHSRLIFKDTPHALKRLPEVTPEGTRRLAVAAEPPSRAMSVLKHSQLARDVTLVESEVHVLLDQGVEEDRIRQVLARGEVAVREIRQVEASLEDVFVAVTRKLQQV